MHISLGDHARSPTGRAFVANADTAIAAVAGSDFRGKVIRANAAGLGRDMHFGWAVSLGKLLSLFFSFEIELRVADFVEIAIAVRVSNYSCDPAR
jgi:hypothetical protein